MWGEWQQKALTSFWCIFIFAKSFLLCPNCCTWVSESNASSDPTYLPLVSTSSSGASSAGKSAFAMPLCRCAASQRICSSSAISDEVAGWSPCWGALQRAFQWCSMIYISNTWFVLSTSPLFSNCMSLPVEPTDAKTSFSFEAQYNNKITTYLFMLVIESTGNCDLIVALTRRLAKGNLLDK